MSLKEEHRQFVEKIGTSSSLAYETYIAMNWALRAYKLGLKTGQQETEIPETEEYLSRRVKQLREQLQLPVSE